MQPVSICKFEIPDGGIACSIVYQMPGTVEIKSAVYKNRAEAREQFDTLVKSCLVDMLSKFINHMVYECNVTKNPHRWSKIMDLNKLFKDAERVGLTGYKLSIWRSRETITAILPTHASSFAGWRRIMLALIDQCEPQSTDIPRPFTQPTARRVSL
jgi:hypothetical protein